MPRNVLARAVHVAIAVAALALAAAAAQGPEVAAIPFFPGRSSIVVCTGERVPSEAAPRRALCRRVMCPCPRPVPPPDPPCAACYFRLQ